MKAQPVTVIEPQIRALGAGRLSHPTHEFGGMSPQAEGEARDPSPPKRSWVNEPDLFDDCLGIHVAANAARLARFTIAIDEGKTANG